MKDKKINDNLLRYSVETPWKFILVVILYTIGSVSFPTSIFKWMFPEGQAADWTAMFLARLLCSAIPLWLIFELQLEEIISTRGFFKNFIYVIPFLLIAINNFPIVSVLEGECKLVSLPLGQLLLYNCACLGIALLEEITFRALIFTTLLRKFKDHKHKFFLSVVLSSAMFGILHMVNLLSGQSVPFVILQISYSFLIGAMCSIAFMKSGNFFIAVLLHYIYDIGGLLSGSNLVSGNIWTPLQIIVTAIPAVIVTIFAVFCVFKDKNNALPEKLSYTLKQCEPDQQKTVD